MKISKRQLRQIIREERRRLADNPYAYVGDDVGPGEIPSEYRSKLYSALSPIGFEIGVDPDSKYFKYDFLDAYIISEKELKKAGFENPNIILDFLKPMLEDIVRKYKSAGAYRTDALVNAIPFEVFNAAAGGPFGTRRIDKSDPYVMFDEEEEEPPMISDSRKYIKQKLQKLVKEEKAKLIKEVNHGGGWDGVFGGTQEGMNLLEIVAFGLEDAGVMLDQRFWNDLKKAIAKLEKRF